jgi:hypothetical protein
MLSFPGNILSHPPVSCSPRVAGKVREIGGVAGGEAARHQPSFDAPPRCAKRNGEGAGGLRLRNV